MSILITGTSSGIGYGLAKTWLNRGQQVYGISRRLPAPLTEEAGYHHLQLDLTDHQQLNNRLPAFLSTLEQLDIVVLNAGILGNIKLLQDMTVNEMKEVVEINVWANKILLDLLLQQVPRIKQIVGISSGASLASSPGWAAYSLSKAALNMLINGYAQEYPKTHFTAFAPGLVDSEIQETIGQIKETDHYPAVKRLHDARHTELMPDPMAAAPRLIAGMEKALTYTSGSYLDVRELISK